MANSKEIKVQIASIGNTQKITSAMEKVAVSKMKKTQDKMLKGRPYRDRMLGVISHLAKGQPEYKPKYMDCLLYTSPSPRDQRGSRMPSSA